MRRLRVVLFCICFIFMSPLFYAETAATQKKTGVAASEWILAAEKFRYANGYVPDESEAAVAGELPQLVLEQITTGMRRTPSTGELVDREQDLLLQDRLTLFLELSKEIKERDSFILKYENPRSLKKAVIDQNKKIAETKKKISENLSKVAVSLQKSEATTGHRKNSQHSDESVRVYKNDTSELFSVPDQNTLMDYTSYAFKKAVADANINGLITGSILTYGGYAAVTAELYVYPGGTSGGAVTEIGLLSEPVQIARNLARALIPKIANSAPVALLFSVNPPAAAGSCSITIDGLVFNSVPSAVVTDAGIHLITFEADGYRRENIRYAFTGGTTFSVRVQLEPVKPGVLHLHLVQPLTGIIYTNGINESRIDQTNAMASVTVNGNPVIGQFNDTTGESLFFYIPDFLSKDGENLLIHAAPYDRSADIEKHRRRMYTAYTALILSLPVAFYTYGKYTNSYNAGVLGDTDYDEAKIWQKRSWAAVGLSATLGVVFSYQLVRYLISANAVLPENVKPEK